MIPMIPRARKKRLQSGRFCSPRFLWDSNGQLVEKSPVLGPGFFSVGTRSFSISQPHLSCYHVKCRSLAECTEYIWIYYVFFWCRESWKKQCMTRNPTKTPLYLSSLCHPNRVIGTARYVPVSCVLGTKKDHRKKIQLINYIHVIT